MQIQSGQLQGQPLTLSDQLLWKLDTSDLDGKGKRGFPPVNVTSRYYYFFFCETFFFLYLLHDRAECMLIEPAHASVQKQTLTADALVFGVYKCLCSLLDVLVLLMLEIDLKRVYFIHPGPGRLGGWVDW